MGPASPPSVPASVHELGVSMGIPADILDAVLRQTGGATTQAWGTSRTSLTCSSCTCSTTHTWVAQIPQTDLQDTH